jgi:hypothetical protein
MRRRCSGLVIAALFVAGCHRDGGVIGQVKLPSISGKFVIEDDDRTVALTSVQHSIYSIESSFFDNEADDAHGLRLLRLQPVTSAGLKANGRSIC